MPTTRLVIALARNAREQAPDDWVDGVLSMDGVRRLVGEVHPQRIVVEVEETAIRSLRSALEGRFHVESPIEHTPREAENTEDPGTE